MEYFELMKNWIMQYHDESTFGDVPYCYNPLLHADGIRFYFNPPFDEDGRSIPTESQELVVTEDGEVFIAEYVSLWEIEWYNLTDCPPQGYEAIYEALYDESPKPGDQLPS